MSSLLSYHIFSFFISNIFENFKFGRNFLKFTAGMGCRLIAVSVKIGGNRRLPIGKENTVTVAISFAVGMTCAFTSGNLLTVIVLFLLLSAATIALCSCLCKLAISFSFVSTHVN